mgnify:CR=1 FL=1
MLYVKKLSGEIIPYDESSLRGSLQKSGANDEQIETVMEEINKVTLVAPVKISRFSFLPEF